MSFENPIHNVLSYGFFQVLATASDSNLGGQDFDRLVTEHFVEDFKNRYRVDARKKPRAFLRLLTEAEKLKKLMSANSTLIPLNLECFMEDKDVTGKIGRSQLEEMGADLLTRWEALLCRVLEVSGAL